MMSSFSHTNNILGHHDVVDNHCQVIESAITMQWCDDMMTERDVFRGKGKYSLENSAIQKQTSYLHNANSKINKQHPLYVTWPQCTCYKLHAIQYNVVFHTGIQSSDSKKNILTCDCFPPYSLRNLFSPLKPFGHQNVIQSNTI